MAVYIGSQRQRLFEGAAERSVYVGADLKQGGGAATFAPYPAPLGYRWEFVFESADQVFEVSDPVIDLVVIS